MKREIWTLDSETDPFLRGRIPIPFLWGAYNGTEYLEFKEIPDLIRFVSNTDAIFYAHNGGKFDYHFLLDYLTPYDPVMIIHGRLVKFKIGKAEMRDSLSILPIALAKYKKDTMDYSIMEADVRDLPENRASIRSYLKSDCVYLYELVTKFIEQYGTYLTLASASMASWEKMHGSRVPDSGNNFYSFFHPWYYGGRVECRERGVLNGEFHLADINSAYPYAMIREHPFGSQYDRVKTDRVLDQGFYTVRARANGCFPIRDDDEKLTFPADNELRNWHVTGWELQTAMELNLLKDLEILERVEFAETVNFSDYIYHHYDQKREAKIRGDKANELFHKLMLNALYGKFGANPANYKSRVVIPKDDVTFGDERYALEGMMGPWAIVADTKRASRSKYYNVATAASITGFERAYLLRALVSSAVRPLYMDTDCILAERFNDLPYGKDLGQWDDQGTFDEIALAGKKLYGLYSKKGWLENGVRKHHKTASKGAKLKYDEIVRLARGEGVIWAADAPTFSLYRGVDFLERNLVMT